MTSLIDLIPIVRELEREPESESESARERERDGEGWRKTSFEVSKVLGSKKYPL
jgi:hypothetical protein